MPSHRLKTIVVILLLNCLLADLAMGGIFGRGRRRGRACRRNCVPCQDTVCQYNSCRTAVIAVYYMNGSCVYKQFRIDSCVGAASTSMTSDCGDTSTCRNCVSPYCFNSYHHSQPKVPRPDKKLNNVAQGCDHLVSDILGDGTEDWIDSVRFPLGAKIRPKYELQLPNDGRWVRLYWFPARNLGYVGLGHEIEGPSGLQVPDDFKHLPEDPTKVSLGITVHTAAGESQFFSVVMKKP